MANRSHLYAIDVVPDGDGEGEQVAIAGRRIGLSEWGWDVPLVHKILASGRPRVCRSTIWNWPKPIAIVGDYDAGVDALAAFGERLVSVAADAGPLVEEALAFLREPKNGRRYCLLEAGEIFELGPPGAELDELNAELLAEINALDATLSRALAGMSEGPVRPSLLGRLLGAKPKAPRWSLENLGFESWSNVLYYHVDLPDEGAAAERG